jgi:hypothetical protein
MNHVVKKIISQIDTESMEDSKHFYVNKERMIRVEGVALKIKLNEKDYEVVKDKNVDVD